MPRVIRARALFRRVLGAALALGTLLSLEACGRERETTISRERYVDVYVRILRAAEAARDSSAATDSARRILQERGLSEDDLVEFARQYVEEAAVLAEIWGEIETRLKEPVTVDSADAGDAPDRQGS